MAAQFDTQLLRSIDYSLRWLAWAKTKDGQSGRNRPDWISFPWEQSPDDGIRGDAMLLDEAAEWLGWTDLIEAENQRRAEVGLPLIGDRAGTILPPL